MTVVCEGDAHLDKTLHTFWGLLGVDFLSVAGVVEGHVAGVEDRRPRRGFCMDPRILEEGSDQPPEKRSDISISGSRPHERWRLECPYRETATCSSPSSVAKTTGFNF